MIQTRTGSSTTLRGVFAALIVLLLPLASAPAQGYRMSPNDTLTSVTVAPDGRATFRLYAPTASAASIGGGDIPEALRQEKMVKNADGVWEVTVGPLAPGSYRYNFSVDNITVVDPRNPSVSESNTNVWSLMHVPGAGFMDTKDVPHGAVSVVTYYSKPLGRFRRMHIYTPPGYEAGKGKYPVFYLLHGAYDSDNSWSTVGRAGIIFDNLIAQKKAVPMVVVMPAGHTSPIMAGRIRGGAGLDEFMEDFQKEVRPYAERTYRVYTDRAHRAIAGLSMGGYQTLNIATADLADYSAIGVFSSGVFELGAPPEAAPAPGQSWEDTHAAALDNKQAKHGLDLLWFATGKEDFLLKISQKTVELYKKHGFTVVYKETAGAHTWTNWREYLDEFAPQLFKPKKK